MAIPPASNPKMPARSPSQASHRPATGLATLVLLVGIIGTYWFAIGQDSVNAIFSTAALGLLASLAISFWIDCRGVLVRLIRVDLLMLIALYGLTYFEFLFDQPPSTQTSISSAETALLATMLGFAGIAVGRHLVALRRGSPDPRRLKVSTKMTFQILLLSTALGYFYMLLSVGLNPVEMVEQMMRPRFTQPWTRGRLGGPSALLAELSLLKAAIPPLCALILAQRQRFSFGKVAVAFLLGIFVLFDGYSSGTRNVFLLYFLTFLGSYFLFAPRMGSIKLALIGVACLITAFVAMSTMLQTRGNLRGGPIELQTAQPVFVDMNLLNVAQLTEIFPRIYPYLGLEIPFNMIIRPIPRALWPGKPEGLSFGIEEALGVGDYMTLSATYVGEFWMAGGLWAVAFGSILLGAIAAFWNRYGARATSQLELIIYVVGFFPAMLCMRSFLSVAPAILPVIALLIWSACNRTHRWRNGGKGRYV